MDSPRRLARRNPARINAQGRQVNARRVYASTPARALPAAARARRAAPRVATRVAKKRVANVLRNKLGNRFGRNANVQINFSPGARAAIGANANNNNNHANSPAVSPATPRTPSFANNVAARSPFNQMPLPNGESLQSPKAVRIRKTPNAIFAVPGGQSTVASNQKPMTLQKLNLPLCAADLLAAIRGRKSIDFLTGAPGSCFYDSLKAKVAPLLARKGWLCDLNRASPRLGPHQVVHIEVAKLMAAAVKTPWAINHRRGLLVWANTGSGKCFARGTPILMADGSVKAVEAVAIGDAVMGDDGTRRTVLTLGRGSEEMYEVVPLKEGEDSFGCNASHILVLRHALHKTITKNRRGKFVARFLDRSSAAEPARLRYPSFSSREAAAAFLDTVPEDDTIHIPVREYLELSATQRRALKQYRVGIDAFEATEEPLFDPYVIGAWLGDGLPNRSRITKVDQAVLDSVRARVAQRGLSLTSLDVHAVKAVSNVFTDALQKYGIFETKRIPQALKAGTRETRLGVLAGLLDTDGHLRHNCFEISQVSEGLARDIVCVARSLGFGATLALSGKMWRATIFGEGLQDIPTILDTKRASARRQIKDARVFGFDIVPKGVGEYFGFTVDGNHRFLLGDFTVTHNTVSALGILLAFWHTPKNLVIATTPANKQDNNLAKYAENLLKFFPQYAPLVLGNDMPSASTMNNSGELAAWAESVGRPALAKRISVLSYHEFGGVSQRYDLDGGFLRHFDRSGNERGSVVIMDEAQNLFLPKLGGQNRAFEKAKRYLINPANFGHIHAFALTATPANTPSEWLQLLNMLRPVGSTKEFTIRDFETAPQKFRGLISYADIRGDRGHYGSIESSANGTNNRIEVGARNLRVEMTPQYYAAFLLAYLENGNGKEVRSIGSSATDAQKFFEASRVSGCALIKGVYSKIFTEAQIRELRRVAPGDLVPTVVPVDNSDVMLSEKMKLLVKNLVRMKGCQYVYCPESNSNRVLKALVSALARISGSEPFARVRSGGLEDALQHPKNRFVVYSNGVISGYGETDAGREKILKAFRDKRNSDGSRIKILIGNVYEGLDLAYLRGVHIVSPLSVKSSDDQAVGRALRYCGHLAGQSSVAVFRYMSVEPRGHALFVKQGKGSAALRTKLERARAELRRQQAGDAEDAANNLAASAVSSNNNTSHLVGSPSAGGASPQNLPNAAINSFVYENAKRRYAPQAALENCLKGESIECGILSSIQFGRAPKCGQCNVQVTNRGNLVSLNEPSPSPSTQTVGGGIRARLRSVLTSYRRKGGWGQRLSPTRQTVHGAVRRVAGSPFATPTAASPGTPSRNNNNNGVSPSPSPRPWNNRNNASANASASASPSPSPSPRQRKKRS